MTPYCAGKANWRTAQARSHFGIQRLLPRRCHAALRTRFASRPDQRGELDLSAVMVANGYTVFLPLVLRGAGS